MTTVPEMEAYFSSARALARFILEHAHSFEWQAQGLGMLRTYITREIRLHVWDSELRAPNASDIHDHPFHFESLVLSGRLLNQRYKRALPIDPVNQRFSFYKEVTILCGLGNPSEPSDVVLTLAGIAEEYRAGSVYHQYANEIHRTKPDDGTLTLVRRTFLPDGDHAHVYYQTPEWGTAVPRPATSAEIDCAIGKALARWGA